MVQPRSGRFFPAPQWFTYLLTCILGAVGPARGFAQEQIIRVLPPDAKHILVRDPAALPHACIPDLPAPPTVSQPRWDDAAYRLGLDDAIRTTLQNTQVVRLLSGVTASASINTIYDAAIVNTTIDQAKARFDPSVTVANTFSKTQEPQAVLDPLDPSRALIEAPAINAYDMNLALSKVNSFGGTTALTVDVNPSRVTPGDLLPLNPETRSSITLAYTQPLLQGGGTRANLAPIVIARLNTERSFFQYKDSVQQSVRGTIQAYWSLVFARTDVWARRRQVEQGEEALRRAEGRLRAGLADLGEVSQARSALANFKATLIASEANELNEEAVLANIMRLPPSARFVPITPPSADRVQPDWDGILRLAEEHRPDLIELKLIIEADQQMLYISRNQARPRLDTSVLYRWNGLEGKMPNGQDLSSPLGQFADWSLGVNFSVPLGLRAGRAALRNSELILARDRANLDQGLHNATHLLALDVRSVAQYYEQYRAYRDARVAARVNLDRQLENYRRGRSILLNALQAITDWGNAVSSESQALTQYQTELAMLEQDTGTILETHGITFWEERYFSLGPMGGLGRKKPYPEALPAGPNASRYPAGTRPSEEFFELQDPLRARPLPPDRPQDLPRPRPLTPPDTLDSPLRPQPLPPADGPPH
jgi:outer membrane protein TolC